jgi:hypothetical protein
MNLEILFGVWEREFGRRPVTASALHWQAYNGNEALADAIGHPLPGSKSLGRLLAARAGMTVAGLQLVRCAGRIGNCALWRIERVID